MALVGGWRSTQAYWAVMGGHKWKGRGGWGSYNITSSLSRRCCFLLFQCCQVSWSILTGLTRICLLDRKTTFCHVQTMADGTHPVNVDTHKGWRDWKFCSDWQIRQFEALHTRNKCLSRSILLSAWVSRIVFSFRFFLPFSLSLSNEFHLKYL